MGFSDKQLKALQRNLDHRRVRTRYANGRELSYIEGWYAISQANRIFGFDAWSRETVESRCVLSRENHGAFLAVYTAKVRITVEADGMRIIREGHGSGEGRANSPGEVHDTALKAAETDATKRALATFGKPFGLELYRKDVVSGPKSTPPSHRWHQQVKTSVLACIRMTPHQSRVHRITTAGGTAARAKTSFQTTRPKQKRKARQRRRSHPTSPKTRSNVKLTKANSRSPSQSACATRLI